MGDTFTAGTGIEEWNPKGFFADYDFEKILCERYDGDWTPKSFTPNNNLVNLVHDRCALDQDWGVKASRIAMLLPEIVEASSCPVSVILTQRSSLRSIASWNARSGTELGDGVIGAAQDSIDAALQNFRGPVLTVDFDALFDATEVTVQSIATFVGRLVTPEALALVDPELRRF